MPMVHQRLLRWNGLSLFSDRVCLPWSAAGCWGHGPRWIDVLMELKWEMERHKRREKKMNTVLMNRQVHTSFCVLLLSRKKNHMKNKPDCGPERILPSLLIQSVMGCQWAFAWQKLHYYLYPYLDRTYKIPQFSREREGVAIKKNKNKPQPNIDR